MARALLALGSNLGDRHAFLAQARSEIGATPGVTLRRASPVEETVPLGGANQPDFLNQMLEVETSLPPEELLELCHQVERNAGRERSVRWAARTLDVDLVSYDSLVCDRPSLVLPHPGLRDRDFWVREIALLEEYV